VLLVEDNAPTQQVAVAMLQRLGYAADVAANGHEAIEALLGIRYDAVLMDWQMPDMDGLAACSAIRRWESESSRTPIIALSATAVPGFRERCLAAGMDDYVAKPVGLTELASVLARWASCGERAAS
jgi:CheY-like chemotaxis protein